jgi:hypothetical protein
MYYGINHMFSCYLGSQMKKNQNEPEVSHIPYQEEKRNNDSPFGIVAIPDSSISNELNTIQKYP